MPRREGWEPRRGKNGYFYVDFTVAGRRIQRSTRHREERLARQEARRIWDQAWRDHYAPQPPRPVGPLFCEAAAAYVRDGGEAAFLEPLILHFGPATALDDIGHAEIAAAAAALYPGRAPATHRRQVHTPVMAVKNHHARGGRRAGVDRARLRWLTPEEAERLIAAAARLTLPRHPAPELHTLAKIAFLLGSGCRTGECFAAEARHWNPATRQCWIAAEARGAGKTAGAARWVRLPRRAVALMGTLPEVGRLFRTAYGKPIALRAGGGGQMAESFTRAREAAGLGPEVTPHVLRHTWATWFYAQTRDFGALMDLGGWTKADTANRYRKLAPDDLADRLRAIGWDFCEKYAEISAPARLAAENKG